MKRASAFIIKHRRAVAVITAVFALLSVMSMLFVRVEYDLASYLPEGDATKISVAMLKREFGYTSTAQFMVPDLTVARAFALKNKIEDVPGVKSVMWLDDAVDINKPLETAPRETVEAFYKQGAALFTVEFTGGDYAISTSKAVNGVREALANQNFSASGDAVSAKALIETARSEIVKTAVIAVVIVVVLLLFLTTSWLEPLLYLLCIGIAILFNFGTNVIFGSISYITNSIQALLQLAISMDYALFLFHRIREERNNGYDVNEAVIRAMRASSVAILASCLTTVAGFFALNFMRYGIGSDIGLVLMKGVVLSFICVMLLLPILYVFTHKAIDKLSHRSFAPRFGKFSTFIVKSRFVFAPLLVLIAVPMFLAQRGNDFVYGQAGVLNNEKSAGYIEKQNIENVFGKHSRIVIMIPSDTPAKENILCGIFEKKPYVLAVQSLSTIAANIPIEMLPQAAVDKFSGKNYVRIILSTSLGDESPQNFKNIADLRGETAAVSEEYYIAGYPASVSDIKDIVETDFPVVSFISIALVILIIMVNFRSIGIPVLLTAVIEASIWINMGIPYFQGTPLTFLGYLIVSSIQLGATIDYAIILTDRYMESRRSLDRFEAAKNAVRNADAAIFTSSLILGTAGICLGIFSNTPSISEMGVLIGRGALISGAAVLIVLPQFLIIFDKIIVKTTLKRKTEAEKNEKD